MPFTKLGAFSKKPSDLPDVPSPDWTPNQIRDTWQVPLDELKANQDKIVDDLNANQTKWVTREKVADGAIGTDQLDPNITKQPKTEFEIQAKFDSLDSQLEQREQETISISKKSVDIPNLASKNQSGVTESKAFELRSASEWDNIGNMTLNYGEMYPTTLAYASSSRAINMNGVTNITIQAKILWDVDQTAMFGFGSQPKGSAVAAANLNSVGFRSAGLVYKQQNGVQTTLLAASELTTGYYDITFTGLLSSGVGVISIQKDGTTEAKVFVINGWNFTCNNICIEMARATDRLRNLKYRASKEATDMFLMPHVKGEVNSHTAVMGSTNGVNTIAHIPASYDVSVPSRWIIYIHGANGKATDLWNLTNEKTLLKPLLDAGYIVIGSDYTSNQNWGNQQSIYDTRDLINKWKQHLNLGGRPFVIMQSMGGLVCANSIQYDALKPKAICGIYPVFDLSESYTHDNLKTHIQSAYGIATDSEFETKTNGYDPANDYSLEKFKEIPYKIWHSNSDTLVPRVSHSDVLKTKIEDLGGSVEIVTTTGDHGDISNFVPSDIVSFFNSY